MDECAAATSSSSASVKKATGLRRCNGNVVGDDGRVVDSSGAPFFLQPRDIVEELTARDASSAPFMMRHRFCVQKLGSCGGRGSFGSVGRS